MTSHSSEQDVKPTILYPIPNPFEQEEEMAVASTMANHNVWAMKIPRFLLERWEQVHESGVELGTLVVDNSVNPPKISLRLPRSDQMEQKGGVGVKDESMEDQKPGPSRLYKRPRYDTTNIPDEYEVHVPEERAKNAFVFTEKTRSWGPLGGVNSIGKRQRDKAEPKLLARVAHECTVQPVRNEKYLRILRQRQLESQQTRRPIVSLESTGLSRGQQYQLASGFANASSTFGRDIVQRNPKAIAAGKRFARLDRTELIDRLFALFNDKPYWGIPAIKSSLKQPDTWLREVLKEVAEPIKEGPYANMWKLKDVWKEDEDGDRAKQEQRDGGVKDEVVNGSKEEFDDDEEEDDDDDDEDGDLEEVLME